ncbi:MAG TPA: 7-cyano-7-deazaguanine synthase QueC [Acidisphaera sp.]|nr:7-cyano-7-deazaguanine synthase QueC [Acidisphaera sp.]
MSSADPSTDGALVLFSGGQDSTTCLAWALDRYDPVETVGFAYGQRHAIELDCRGPLRDALATMHGWGDRLGSDHIVDMGQSLAGVTRTSLTSDMAFAMTAEGLPNTFVPGRNLLFLTYAAAIAWRRGLRRIVAGMCETDYSGYPDCRDDTTKAMQLALNLGMQRRFVLETPLMWRDKAATWTLAQSLGGDALVSLIVEATHSCYLGDRTHRHDWGYGCGACPACELRRAGWQRWRAQAA